VAEVTGEEYDASHISFKELGCQQTSRTAFLELDHNQGETRASVFLSIPHSWSFGFAFFPGISSSMSRDICQSQDAFAALPQREGMTTNGREEEKTTRWLLSCITN
jgi:hypothetical protein